MFVKYRKARHIIRLSDTSVRYLSGSLFQSDSASRGFITDDEFLSAFRDCKPPGEWADRVGKSIIASFNLATHISTN